ncbi:DUF6576 domain-containing protein [Flavobacterium croceum]|uniref:DUF6576 domain-containing protein n=1 Tax=Flavobacterium croceum DSM 17960 TaxID=1121886 RepID=A0A2S4N6M3_9FLAO|nr:DUF6576 domain-containing protein [Flavobacterium croceum]POS01362.1 hypothetical protein Q361_11173 [Flavobacterium croceum DSM 17960]
MNSIAFFVIVVLLLFLLYYFVVQKNKSLHSFTTTEKYKTIEDKYNEQKYQEKKELDVLLEKVSNKGLKSLTKLEIDRLNELSGKL